MTCHQQQIFTLLSETGVNCLRLSNHSYVSSKNQIELTLCACKWESCSHTRPQCWLSRAWRLLFLSVMRISYYEVRFKGLSTNFKVEILQKGSYSNYNKQKCVTVQQNLTHDATEVTCMASLKINVKSAEYSLRFPHFPFLVLIVACRCSFMENSTNETPLSA